MKYTKYLIYGDYINDKALSKLPKVFLPITLAVAFSGIVIIAGAIPFAFIIDVSRNVHYNVHRIDRKYHVSKTIKDSKPYEFIDRNVQEVGKDVNYVLKKITMQD